MKSLVHTLNSFSSRMPESTQSDKPVRHLALKPRPPETMPEATLKLRLIDGENLKDIRFLGKMKTFAVTWIDPRFKKSTTTLTSSTRNPNYNFDLFFPLTPQTLQNPNSCITIQILSPPSPIHQERVVGTAIMPLSDVRLDDQMFTLQLWRPSGRAYGLLRVTARVELCSSAFCSVGCVTGIPLEANSAQAFDQIDTMRLNHSNAVPSAPPADLIELPPLMDEAESYEADWGELPPGMDEADSVSAPIETNPAEQPPLIPEQMGLVECSSRNSEVTLEGVSSSEGNLETTRLDGSNAFRSFLVGVLGGAVAVATVLVGSNTS